MNPRQHAMLARTLIEKCGGLAEASAACRISKALLSQCQTADSGAFMAIDVVADLEAYCGEPVYSRALFEARPSAVMTADVVGEVCDSVQSAADLMKRTREATADGTLTTRERDELRRAAAANLEQAREAFEVIDGGRAVA